MKVGPTAGRRHAVRGRDNGGARGRGDAESRIGRTRSTGVAQVPVSGVGGGGSRLAAYHVLETRDY